MRRGSIALTPALIALLAILAFLAVLNFAITKPEATNTTNSTNNANLANGSVANANTDRTLVTNANTTNGNTNVAADPTAGWETYTNQDLGFRIQLPPDWIVDTARSSVDEIVLTDGAESENREAVKSTLTTQALMEWATVYQGEDGYRVTDYTLDGQPGKRVRYSGIGTDYIGVKLDGRLYVVTVGRMETNGMLARLDLVP